MNDLTDDAVEQWARLLPDVELDALQVTHRLIWLAKAVEAAIDDVVARGELRSKGDYDTLAVLVRNDGAMSPSALARLTFVTNAGMTGRLDLLESLGYVERVVDPRDRRRTTVLITPLGRGVVLELGREAIECQRRLTSGLSQGDRAELARLLRDLGATVVPARPAR